MPWSAGTYTRSNGSSGWANDAAALIGITPSRHDDLDNDLATGINSCLNKSGQNAPTGNLPMGGFIHTNVGVATARTSYAQLGQTQDGAFLWGGTSAGSANAQTISLTPALPALVAGLTVKFIAGFTNTAAATLSINGLTASNILRPDGNILVAGDITVNGIYQVVYAGSSTFILMNITRTPVAWTPTYGAQLSGSYSGITTFKAAYVYDNKCVSFVFYSTGTVSGGPPTTITVSIPFGTGAAGLGGLGAAFITEGITNSVGTWALQAGSNVLQFAKPAGTISTGALSLYASGVYFVA